MNIALFYGGKSGEHDVSCISAQYLEKLLIRCDHTVFPVYVSRQGYWYAQEQVSNKPQFKLNLSNSTFTSTNGVSLFLENQSQKTKIDFIFPIIHGITGEDGSLQGLAQFLNLPYAGCGVLASAVCMHKKYMNDAFANANLPQPKYLPVTISQWRENPQQVIDLALTKLGLPIFSKPCNAGSSVGVTKINSHDDFSEKIAESFGYDEDLVLETGHNIRELEVAIVGKFPNYEVSLAGEVISNHDFYSYEAKYLDDEGANFQIPVSLESGLLEKIQDMARKAFAAVNGEGFARIDFFQDLDTQEIFINEINTLPGFTPISMFPKLWQASDITIESIIEKIIDLGLKRNESTKIPSTTTLS